MKGHLLLAEFARTVWAITPDALAKIATVLTRWSAGEPASRETMETVAADMEARTVRQQQAAAATGGGIAVLPLQGILTQRPVEQASGPGTLGISGFTQMFRAAMADPSISQILLDIDSPGGSVGGVSELADEIYSARGQKPVIGVANSLAASAAYWIGSQCSEFYCTPGGMVGSIGVYTAHADMSQKLAQDGINMTLISAGKYKTEGNPLGPLDEEGQAAIQAQVDGYYAMFTKAVARGRGVPISQVRDGMGQGRVLMASDALSEKMIDGIKSFDEVVAGMQKTIRQQQRSTNAEDLAPEMVAEAVEQVEEPAPANPEVSAGTHHPGAEIARRLREIESLG